MIVVSVRNDGSSSHNCLRSGSDHSGIHDDLRSNNALLDGNMLNDLIGNILVADLLLDGCFRDGLRRHFGNPDRLVASFIDCDLPVRGDRDINHLRLASDFRANDRLQRRHGSLANDGRLLAVATGRSHLAHAAERLGTVTG